MKEIWSPAAIRDAQNKTHTQSEIMRRCRDFLFFFLTENARKFTGKGKEFYPIRKGRSPDKVRSLTKFINALSLKTQTSQQLKEM